MSTAQRVIEKTTPMFAALGITYPAWWPSLSDLSAFSSQMIPIFGAIAGLFYSLVMIRKWWVGSWLYGRVGERDDTKKSKAEEECE